MFKSYLYFFLAFTITFPSLHADSAPKGFVLIEGASFNPGTGVNQHGDLVRIEDFEILDHPVTNREYKAFIDATGYPPPLHWKDGEIPAGKEDFPVIFVNRYDVDEYLQWLSLKDGRIYRLPTDLEYEYAARGGLTGKTYPWGDANPEGHANYDFHGDREFDRWEDYLKPARRGESNGYGLYGTAGNVWHLVIENDDPATERWKYRIENPTDIERAVMGGSWARTESYLRCGYELGVSPGIRHPDIGFRPVREPEGEVWGTVDRNLTAVSTGKDAVFLSWGLLTEDPGSIRFNVYRAQSRNHAGFRVNSRPISGSTNFADSDLETGERYQYYVRSVDVNGKEGRRSNWTGVTVSDGNNEVVTTFKPLFKQGNIVPIFGDLTGDGVNDCVVRLDNGNQEMSQDPGIPVQLEAFTSYGRSLWRKDICYHDHCYGSANNVPFNVWDMDGDARADIITRMQIGDSVYVAILDGMSGEVKHTAPWPEMVSDFAKSSTRIHLSIAYLDGRNPAVVTQTGLYENEVFVAFDHKLNELWRFESFKETNGSGGHKIEVADVDGDGTQEVFDGTTCLNSDGTMRWSIYRGHPDIVSIHDYLPDREGLEVFYIVETSIHAGVYMVDASSGEVIWKVNREDDPRWTHGHRGWSADIWAESPGMECISNRQGHDDHTLILFAADGRQLLEPFPYWYVPLEWDGDTTRELLGDGNRIGDFDGKNVQIKPDGQPVLPSNSGVMMTADLYGDFRDELVLSVTESGSKHIAVVTATDPVEEMYVMPSSRLGYRLWVARNMGGGYRSVYDQPLLLPKK